MARALFSIGPGILLLALGSVACGDDGVLQDSGFSSDAAADAVTDGGLADSRLADGDLPEGGRDAEPSLGRAIYPTTQTHSPIGPSVVRRLQEAVSASDRSENVVLKAGASITAAPPFFLGCFASDPVDLGSHAELSDTLDFFLAGDVMGEDSFSRESTSAVSGWAAFMAIEGADPPLVQEIAATNARFAVVMYGTNDIGYGNLDRFATNMLDIADTLLEGGTIPIFTSIPPRDDGEEAGAQVRFYNSVTRGIAQGREFPYVDYHRELLALPDHGLSGDGIHPTAFSDGGRRACHLSEEALAFGYNVRNRLTLEALDRARRAALGAEGPLDSPTTTEGTGTAVDPFRIRSLPFTDIRNTSLTEQRHIDRYTGCDAGQDESGPEYFYRLDLETPTRIRVQIFDRGSVDVDVHVLGDEPTGSACEARDHEMVTVDLAAGTWHLALDSFVSGGETHAGEYLLIVLEEP